MGPFSHEVKHRVAEPFRRLGVHGMRYRIIPSVPFNTPSGILQALGVAVESGMVPAEQLLALVEGHVAHLEGVPDVALVIPREEPGDAECTDLLTAVTIITKCSEKVFIKSKRPLLSRLRKQRCVVLLFPDPKEN